MPVLRVGSRVSLTCLGCGLAAPPFLRATLARTLSLAVWPCRFLVVRWHLNRGCLTEPHQLSKLSLIIHRHRLEECGIGATDVARTGAPGKALGQRYVFLQAMRYESRPVTVHFHPIRARWTTSPSLCLKQRLPRLYRKACIGQTE